MANFELLFKEFDGLNLDEIPTYLQLSKHIREIELGTEYFQVKNTKLICSSYREARAQLYKIERFDLTQPYTMTAVEPMDMTVWMFNPNIEAISTDLHKLYADLRDYATFSHQSEWVNYYINRLALIYQKQSQVDSLMSQSFDFFFQTKDEYVFGHFPNTPNTALDFKEISTNSAPI